MLINGNRLLSLVHGVAICVTFVLLFYYKDLRKILHLYVFFLNIE